MPGQAGARMLPGRATQTRRPDSPVSTRTRPDSARTRPDSDRTNVQTGARISAWTTRKKRPDPGTRNTRPGGGPAAATVGAAQDGAVIVERREPTKEYATSSSERDDIHRNYVAHWLTAPNPRRHGAWSRASAAAAAPWRSTAADPSGTALTESGL